jgi:hypothetical protein
MKNFPKLNLFFVTALTVIFVITSGVLPGARAAVIDTRNYLEQQGNGSAAKVDSFLEREDVQKQLIRLGVDPADAKKRVAGLTAGEIRELEKRIDELPAGSGVLAVLGIVLIVLIVLELTGVSNIFSKM